MPGANSRLKPKHEKAILALLSETSNKDAARVVGIGERTLYRWQNDPEFKVAFQQVQRVEFAQSVARLQRLSGSAVSLLEKVMEDPNQPAASRVRAAHTVLNHAAEASEIEDLKTRLIALEKAVVSKTSTR